MKPYLLKAHEAALLMQKKELSSVELTESVLERIKQTQPLLNEYVTVLETEALKAAADVDEARAKGEELPALAGIPAAIKDNICVKGTPTTCASKMLADFKPVYNAGVIEKLNQNRVVYAGKANMDEFAMGSSNETSFFGPVSNPYDTSCIPGGSSGGSAASVAADSSIFALGTDTGGSIRQPASLCGVTAIKPTYGRVSRYGVVAFASSLDQVGAFTKDVKDCALVLNAICGNDPKDSTSLPLTSEDFTQGLEKSIKGLRIGVPKEYYGDGIAPEVREITLNAVKQYEAMGAHVEEFSLKLSKYALPVYYLISSAEASSNLGRYDGVRYGFRDSGIRSFDELFDKTRNAGYGSEVKRRIMLGTYVLQSGYYDAYYHKAQQVRTLIKREYDEAFSKFDVLITPASPTTAWTKGEKLDDALAMYASDVCTVSVNIAGLPALVLPCGYDAAGKPVGMQIIGNSLEEAKILNTAYQFEQTFSRIMPKI